jgi:hypothetical protein
MALCLLPVFSADAQARGPGSSAQVMGYPRGWATVTVDAQYLAPTSCQYIASMRRTAPAGAAVPRRAVPLTVVVATASGPCVRRPTLVRNATVVFPDNETWNVVVYFVTPSGKRLKTEQIPILGL